MPRSVHFDDAAVVPFHMEPHSQHSMSPSCGLSQAYTGREIISCEIPLLCVGDVKQCAANKTRSIRKERKFL